MAKFKSLVRLIGHCSVHRKFVLLRAPLRRTGCVKEAAGKECGKGRSLENRRGLRGRAGHGQDLQEGRRPALLPPSGSERESQRTGSPSWSPLSPGPGSFAQVSGTNE